LIRRPDLYGEVRAAIRAGRIPTDERGSADRAGAGRGRDGGIQSIDNSERGGAQVTRRLGPALEHDKPTGGKVAGQKGEPSLPIPSQRAEDLEARAGKGPHCDEGVFQGRLGDWIAVEWAVGWGRTGRHELRGVEVFF
jgi:hypothetical protein